METVEWKLRGSRPISHKELCFRCVAWLPTGDHLAHDQELHPESQTCVQFMQRTFTHQEQEYFDAENRPIRVGLGGGRDPE